MHVRPSRGPRIVVSLILLLVIVTPASAAEPFELQARPLGQPPSTPSAAFVPGELIVRFAPTATGSARASALASVGARVKRDLRLPGAILVSLPEAAGVRAAAASLARRPGVLYAQPNHLYRTFAKPDDPRFGELWGLSNSKDRDIDAPAAWDVTTGSDDVVVAVVDSGVDYLHPDLAGNMWANPDETADEADNDGNGLVDDVRGWDFVGVDNDPMDPNGHGTHVAGTIGASGNNGEGISGVNWDVSLMALRAGDADGNLEDADVVDAFEYACSEGAQVINASFGGSEPAPLLSDAITACPQALFVIAAGNSGTNNDVNPTYPCALPQANIVCVAATGRDDHLTGFSNFGDGTVDLAAPGDSILSASHHEVLFADGFESGMGRWDRGKVFGKSWSVTTNKEATGHYSVTDSAVGDYTNNSNTWIDTEKTFDLSEGSGCQLDFAISWTTQFERDWLLVEGTNDGWQTGALIDGIADGDFAYTGSSGSGFVYVANVLENDGFDSTARDFEFGFRLVSNGSTHKDGAYVDDVLLHCLTGSHGSRDFVRMSGTSMAAPHVAGVAALMLSAYPAASVADLKDALLDGTDDLSALSGLVASGGRLNARGALDALDEVAPVASAPSHRLVENSTLSGSKVPLKVAWEAATDAAPSSGIAEYRLQVRTKDGGEWGSWSTVANTAALSATEMLPPGRHQFRVRATDGGGNVSDWAVGEELVLRDPQGASSIDFVPTWSTQTGSSFYDGSTRYAGRNATATHAFTGTQVAWVASRGPNRGRAKVFIDGTLAATVDLYSGSTKHRRVVFLQKWSTSGAHTIKIKVISPNEDSSGSRVDLDAFLTLE